MFYFGGNFGNDTIELVEGGNATLVFETVGGSWDPMTNTFSCGENSVTVIGSGNFTLSFAGVDFEGAFLDSVSEKIFEDKNKGLIA